MFARFLIGYFDSIYNGQQYQRIWNTTNKFCEMLFLPNCNISAISSRILFQNIAKYESGLLWLARCANSFGEVDVHSIMRCMTIRLAESLDWISRFWLAIWHASVLFCFSKFRCSLWIQVEFMSLSQYLMSMQDWHHQNWFVIPNKFVIMHVTRTFRWGGTKFIVPFERHINPLPTRMD